ncbi:MAG TPA: hypothetical protein PJ988_14620 [Anaerolinea sp.]|nr:hypothetical protein [Anaerolinea sp.]
MAKIRLTLFILITASVLLLALPARAAAPQQNDTPYPNPVETGYPGDATPTFDQGYQPPDEPTAGPTLPPPGAGTPSLAPTILFGTEDSEMGNSLVTPPPSETPQPSPTLTPTATPSATPGNMAGFHLNRQLFTMGFLLPLGLLVAGWLGYRLLRTGEFKSE